MYAEQVRKKTLNHLNTNQHFINSKHLPSLRIIFIGSLGNFKEKCQSRCTPPRSMLVNLVHNPLYNQLERGSSAT